MVDVTERFNAARVQQSCHAVLWQHVCVQVEAVIVGDTSRGWGCCSLSLSERFVRNPTCRREEAVQRWNNRTVVGVWATLWNFWWTGGGLQRFFCSLFNVNASDLPINIQPEIIDLQCDSDLKGKFATAGLDTIYQYLLAGYPNLKALAGKKVLCLFRTTYLCEQVFSVMDINETKLLLRLMHKHMNDILKLAAS